VYKAAVDGACKGRSDGQCCVAESSIAETRASVTRHVGQSADVNKPQNCRRTQLNTLPQMQPVTTSAIHTHTTSSSYHTSKRVQTARHNPIPTAAHTDTHGSGRQLHVASASCGAGPSMLRAHISSRTSAAAHQQPHISSRTSAAAHQQPSDPAGLEPVLQVGGCSENSHVTMFPKATAAGLSGCCRITQSRGDAPAAAAPPLAIKAAAGPACGAM
jgi:hypothetical protein